MLEASRRLTLAPSSNLSDNTDSTWFHLLPSLDLDNVVCVGNPPGAVTRLLETHSRSVVTVQPGQPYDVTDGTSCDLVVFATRQALDLEWAATTLRPLLDDALAITLLESPRGSLIGGRPSVADRDRIAALGGDGGWVLIPGRRHQGRPMKRITRAARLGAARLGRGLSLDWAPAAKHASDLELYRPIPVSTSGSLLRGTLVRTNAAAEQLPAYVTEIATHHGLDLDPSGWSYGPARGFRSQKIVFVASDRSSGKDVIVKSTQETRFNDRLAAEAGALAAIRERNLGASCVVPKLLFCAKHAGLLLIAQTKLDGVPFRQAAQPDPGSRVWNAAIEAVTELAASTAHPTAAGELTAALDELVASYCDIFSPPTWVVDELGALAGRLGSRPLPAVMQHGDLGVWNLLADPGGQIGILDWENADSSGMPLWDLYVFARTFGIFAADAAGTRYGPTVFARQLLEPSSMQEAVAEAARQYCSQLQIEDDAAEELFSLCWVQQAIREAATQPSPSWQSGRNNRYVEASLKNPFRLR